MGKCTDGMDRHKPLNGTELNLVMLLYQGRKHDKHFTQCVKDWLSLRVRKKQTLTTEGVWSI